MLTHAGVCAIGQHQPVQHHHHHVVLHLGASDPPVGGSQVYTLSNAVPGHCKQHRNHQEDATGWRLLPCIPAGELDIETCRTPIHPCTLQSYLQVSHMCIMPAVKFMIVLKSICIA